MARRVAKSARQMRKFLDSDLELTEDEMVDITTKLALDAFTDLIIRTPFDTGFAMSSWRVALNFSDDAEVKPVRGQSYMPPVPAIPQVTFGDSVHLYNNCAYIGRLEDGWSDQAPQGMVWPVFEKTLEQARILTASLSKKRLN